MNDGMLMTEYTQVGSLRVAGVLHRFIEDEALPGSGVESAVFWRTVEQIVTELGPRNRELLRRRDELQRAIDDYHRAIPGVPDPAAYREFLREIGYLADPPAEVRATTAGVDAEIAEQAGPQLVVPLLNARFAVNAANARWGSLYDALYGTDVIPETDGRERGRDYNPVRGAEVVAFARRLLDEHLPLAGGSHADAVAYRVDGGRLRVELADGSRAELADPAQFAGHVGDPASPAAVLLRHNGLHIEVQFDREHPIGALDRAGVKDVVLESAVTTIMDLEDSVAAVDPGDKTLGYRNWLRLNRGELDALVEKGGTSFVRTMHPDRRYAAPDGGELVLPGRSLLFIRQVGHLMTTDAVLDPDGNEVGEGLLDALVTTLGSLHDIRGVHELHNSRTGAMYVVKPKQHGPEEVAFTVEVLRRIEDAFGLPPATIKLGIMDEERRTTLNLAACVAAAADRVAFINTGFLDRTGDEIHTSLLAGPFLRKAELRQAPFMAAYERHNVDVGLAAGFPHRAQIGKGMWARPNDMAAMLAEKIGHPRAGATTAWVPSPTAATLHALHYHAVDVFAVQEELADRGPAPIDPILEIPLAPSADWSPEEVREELDNNVQSILGYVVRWIDQGIGCSTVPDIHDVGLMEDRATLRISSQLLANWLAHGVVTREQVLESLERVSGVVDRQNAADPAYQALIGEGPGIAWRAARDLILLGAEQPNGYTEPILHAARRARKAELGLA